jgi:hypothetical protein
MKFMLLLFLSPFILFAADIPYPTNGESSGLMMLSGGMLFVIILGVIVNYLRSLVKKSP